MSAVQGHVVFQQSVPRVDRRYGAHARRFEVADDIRYEPAWVYRNRNGGCD